MGKLKEDLDKMSKAEDEGIYGPKNPLGQYCYTWLNDVLDFEKLQGIDMEAMVEEASTHCQDWKWEDWAKNVILQVPSLAEWVDDGEVPLCHHQFVNWIISNLKRKYEPKVVNDEDSEISFEKAYEDNRFLEIDWQLRKNEEEKLRQPEEVQRQRTRFRRIARLLEQCDRYRDELKDRFTDRPLPLPSYREAMESNPEKLIDLLPETVKKDVNYRLPELKFQKFLKENPQWEERYFQMVKDFLTGILSRDEKAARIFGHTSFEIVQKTRQLIGLMAGVDFNAFRLEDVDLLWPEKPDVAYC